MGKTKRQKKRPKVKNPTGLRSVKDLIQEAAELGAVNSPSKNETAIHAVLDQLQSPNVENKVFGLQTLATVFTEAGDVAEAARHQLVRIAAPLLLDSSSFVRNIAAGALRNLSVSGGPEMCNVLVEQDVMTPLSALIQEYSGEWRPSKNPKIVDKKADTFLQAVHLLWNLCESNSMAVKYFNERNMLSVLAKCLDVDVFGLEIVIAVAQCIQTVTEDNTAAICKLQDSEPVLQQLLRLEGDDPAILLLRILAAGLLVNAQYGRVSSLAPGVLTQVVGVVVAALGRDHRQALSQLASALLPSPMPTPDEEEELERVVLHTGFLLDAQQAAIEMLANLSSGDDLDDGMDQDSSDTSDEMLSDVACGNEEENAVPMENLPINILPEVHEGIAAHQLVQKLWEKTVQPAENVIQMLGETPEGQQTLKKVSTLRSRAFLCLNNLVSSLDVEDFGGCDKLYQMWLSICTLVLKQPELDDSQLLEAASAALRATLQKLAELKATTLISQVSESDLMMMFEREQQCTVSNVRANLIRSVGILGMVLISAQSPTGPHLIKAVGKFLLDTLGKESELWVVAEALDTIMDLFGEDETDKEAAELGLVERLQVLLPTVRSKVRQQRRSLGDHYLTVMTVNTNLKRFIAYKGQRVARCTVTNGSTSSAKT